MLLAAGWHVARGARGWDVGCVRGSFTAVIGLDFGAALDWTVLYCTMLHSCCSVCYIITLLYLRMIRTGCYNICYCAVWHCVFHAACCALYSTYAVMGVDSVPDSCRAYTLALRPAPPRSAYMTSAAHLEKHPLGLCVALTAHAYHTHSVQRITDKNKTTHPDTHHPITEGPEPLDYRRYI